MASDTADQPNRIQVVVRVRPVLPQELADEVAVTCSQDARRLQVLLPDRLSGGANVLPGATRSGARSYEFDACLPGNTTQEELYDTCGLQELVEAALDGYCVTVFAFGQTGSGKTHTIIGPRLSRGPAGGASPSSATGRLNATGSAGFAGGGGSAAGGGGGGDDLLTVPGSAASGTSARSLGSAASAAAAGGITIDPEDGILTRCISAAYRSIEARSGSSEFSVTASVVELYNEAVTDLLALDKTKQLQVRKDSRDGFAVTGLTQVSCPTDVSAVRYMVRALQYRHTRGHKLNEYSSRSHCLMTFVFASKEAGPGGQMGAKGGIRRYGKLALVDLAGSERLRDTGNTEKGAVRETGAINKSLFTLGQVLGALSARSSGSTSAFVPFRDSKLTQLLWDGLRGSGRCLMLACLGPMRAAAEESLNTLHFATMATRIKAEPVVLLDPQDQLVLDLRKTILQLREENRQLAGALQQLSGGADPSAVLAGLPEALRASAGTVSGSGGGGPRGSIGSGSVTPTEDPGTPQRPQHLQQSPAPGPTGRGRQPFEGAVTEAAAAVGNGSGSGSGGYGYVGGGGSGSGYMPPQSSAPMQQPTQPTSSQQQQQQQSMQLVQSVNSGGLGLRVSYDSSQGGYGGGGGGGQHYQQQQPYRQQSQQQYMQYPQQSQPYPQQQQRGPMGQPTEIPSPVQLSAVNSQARSKRAVGRRPSPVHAAYGAQGRRGAGGGRGGSPRAKSVGRSGGGGGRPTYLTEDPGALLFGYSSALQPPPLPASGNSSSMSLPALVPTRGSPGVAPPPPALSEFPELAAMEAEFQSMMAIGGGGAAKRAPPGSGSGAGGGGGGGAAAPAASRGAGRPSPPDADPEGDEGPKPDVRALRWAERNSWFGTDYDMTAYAYQVHDRLVDVERVDPASETYYSEIERRVAEKFPDRWARATKDHHPGGSGAAAAAAVRRAAAPAASPSRLRGSSGEPLASPTPSYSSALRVNVKEPLYRSTASVSGSVSGSGSGNSRDVAASLAAQAAAARARQPQGQLQPGGASASYDAGQYDAYGESNGGGGGGSEPATPLYAATSSGMVTPPMGGAVNPFNIGALHSVAPPKAARVAHVPGGGQGLVLVPAGAEPLGRGGAAGSGDVYADPNAAERIQREYARQRALVVEELRKAKEEAESERQRILARIQRAAGGNSWR
ncbi:hypothetical protein PLESTB_000530800 [Pleodorina starrii]|uniref:Kinesin motor domain-containing protein n=1 Tax=Pleodorina starrii TaxID=330485 RepID=A0A9W6F042_9CHLO|nr:hypothetical protein PLESTB_000530800 [Pleodorina starrii]